MRNSLIQRTIETIRDVVTTPLDRELSIYARDALAKAIYDRLFTWLVQRINNSLQADDSRRNDVMGILDIYGFEIFEKNRLEFGVDHNFPFTAPIIQLQNASELN